MADTTTTIHGCKVPKLGLGTYKITGDTCRESVAHALTMGYRHIDTAQMYQNEAEVGAGIAEAPVAREDLFLTTKVWHTNLAPTDVKRTTEESLRALGTDYVDLLLIHWPAHLDGDVDALRRTLDAFVEVHEAGQARHIGVSNFSPKLLQQTVDHLPDKSPLFAHQAEYHPFLSQKAVLQHARAHGYLFTAYRPLARGAVLQNERLKAIANRHGKSTAQVAIRWLIQQPNVAAIPKAASAAHRVSNLDVFDFALSDDEMTAIHGLARSERQIDPAFAPAWDATT